MFLICPHMSPTLYYISYVLIFAWFKSNSYYNIDARALAHLLHEGAKHPRAILVKVNRHAELIAA